MKKILFVSAAALALLATSCKKSAEKAEDTAAKVEATVEQAAEQAVDQAAQVVESAAFQEINTALAAIKEAATNATKEDVASLVAKLTEVKALFESKAADMSEDEQNTIKTIFNEIADLVKSKNN